MAVSSPAVSPTGLYAHVAGWGMAVPDRVLSNEDISAIVETTDEWIMSRTGIRERRIASDRESTATLGLKAAQRALDVADVLPAEIDLIICATSTAEYIFPSAASLIQGALGATQAGAFDLSAACSGFVYALEMAAQSIRSGAIKTAVVIGAETMSRVVDWHDRGTCILFGDGAGAVVLRASRLPGGVLSAVLRSDGTGSDLLGLPTFGSIDTDGIDQPMHDYKLGKMHMNGGEVFKFATRVMAESLPQAAEAAGITLNDVKLIVPHQANARILQAAARALKIDEGRFMSNLERYGNTSAASIPIALCEAVTQGRVADGDYVAFVGFGGGLSWAAMVLQWGAPDVAPGTAGRFNWQRRRLSYAEAYWRRWLARAIRRLSRVFGRLPPVKGRMSRLSRDIDQELP
ncbi:MAG TPA: beta-ketoacyl-ACP synthase III [Candidatus Limnocylindrales bacterium]|nr:beta-ketoacyl-ACP synthase III [Candidatus Limnocylindrales bacterium]